MRICFLTRSLLGHQVGGMERQTQLLCDSLAKLGHSVDIITTAHPEGGAKEEVVGNQRILYLGGTEPGKYSVEWWVASQKAVSDLHHSDPFDIIHSQSIGAYALREFSKEQGIPFVSTCHGTPLSDTKTHLVTHRLRSKPIGVAGTLMYLPHHYSVYKSSEAVIAVSPQIRDHLLKFKFAKRDSVTVIPNGTDTETFGPHVDGSSVKERLGIEDNKTVLFIGRLVEEKGGQYAIQAMHKIVGGIENVVLVVAGTGSYQSRLKELAEELGIPESVIFTDFVQEEELPLLYAASDVLVFPTTHVEGFPLVLAEALASGLPIITSNIGGTPTAVSHGKTGYLFEPKDVDSLASHLEALLSDDALRREMSENARRVSLEKFSAERMALRTSEVYQRLSR